MNLEAHDKKVEKILNNPKEVQKKIGSEMAKMLKKRFNQLQASNNFKEYVDIGIGKPHPLLGELSKCYGIHLTKNYRLIVEPLTESLDIESLKKCQNINIKGVLDYHAGKYEWIIP